MFEKSRERKPPVLFGATDAMRARRATTESDADAPIRAIPRELVALILDQLFACDPSGVSVCLCLLASPLFHVLSPPLAWRYGERLRALSTDPDELVAALPPYLCRRLLCRNVLTKRAIVNAAARGNTQVVQTLWYSSSRYAGRYDHALRLARANQQHETVAFLVSVCGSKGTVSQRSALGGTSCSTHDQPTPYQQFETRLGFDVLDGTFAAADACTACWPDLIIEDGASDDDHGNSQDDPTLLALFKPPRPIDPERNLRLAQRLVDHMSREDMDTGRRQKFILDVVIPYACHFVVMGQCEALALLVDRHQDTLCAWARIQPNVVPLTATAGSAPLREVLADSIQRPLNSLVMLRRLMARGDTHGVAALCERRRALGLLCDAGITYNILPYTCNMSGYDKPTEISRAIRNAIDGDMVTVLAADARAFQLDVARAAGDAAHDSLSYIQAAAMVGAAATVDWALEHANIKWRIRATVRQSADPSVVGALVRRRCLADPVRTIVALTLSGRTSCALSVVAAYPDARAHAIDLLLNLSIERGDPLIVDAAMSLHTDATLSCARMMDDAAGRAPLPVLLAMAHHGGARCTRRGVAAAMRRLHGVVMDHLYQNRTILCEPDVFDVRTHAQKRAWKRILDETAGAGYMDNAQRMGQRLGIDGFRRAAVYAAVVSGKMPALGALCAEHVDCGPRAFTRTIGRNDRDMLYRLVSHRPNRASTYAPVLAIVSGRRDLALALIDAGCAVGADALIAAASEGCEEVVKRLLRRLTLRRRTLNKAQKAAARSGYTDIEALLLNHPL
ncbi:hypothetical protein pmac_cds_824 [Pandoravirus macleodensis]|uniref:Ankyrin repeat domain containing protein n=1 Tax=Pandoravirus macleodensis TaxID=2107707 RepID=A0A2U7UGC7_9VIRU|nr:hypothetical protein pmac_cds_824 [Pandoravirus macleodensis]AVK77512.1 hypothetical protein pmac_cds_824 [Pandoravirus macleodensis]